MRPHLALLALCLAAADAGPTPPAGLIRLPLSRKVEANRVAYWANPDYAVGLIEGTDPAVCTLEMDSGSSWIVALPCEELRRRLFP